MPARKAIKSGKWSQNIWDVVPSVGDDVFANGYVVEIDQDINVGTLTNALSSGYAIEGGNFNISNNRNIIANSSGIIGSNSKCISLASIEDIDFLNITASNIVNGLQITTTYVNATINSPVNSSGIYLNSPASKVTVNGNVNGGIVNDAGYLIVNGSISNLGVLGNSLRNEFTGPLLNISGLQAVACAGYLIKPNASGSYTQINSQIFNDCTKFNNTNFPLASSVSFGTSYASLALSGISSQVSGTMIVPSKDSVSFGTPVGNTTGTAILNSLDLQKLWETNTNTLTSDGTIGKKLANFASISDLGTSLTTINL